MKRHYLNTRTREESILLLIKDRRLDAVANLATGEKLIPLALA